MAEEEERPVLPKRKYGTHLPPAAYRKFVGRAKVTDNRWASDDASVRIVLNGLKNLAAEVSDESPVVGQTYLLKETDYRYGVGPLLVRVTKVLEPSDFGEAEKVEVWWLVEAMTKHPDTIGPGLQRELYVRALALKAAR